MRLKSHTQQFLYVLIALSIIVLASTFSLSLLRPHQVLAAADQPVPPASPEELVPLDGQKQPESAPAQQWQYKQGMLAARGGLSSGGANGTLSIAKEAPEWLWDLRLDSGLLNGDFGVNMSAAGGWSPDGNYGAFLKLSGEFSSKAWEHFQALLNMGWRPMDKLSLVMTLDYLQKRTEVEAWDKAEYLNQYGIGLETAYRITPSISLSGLFMHYDTKGKQFGKIGEYEYTDDDNWYHYGHIFGGVRGGQYNEVGLEARYGHPAGWFSLSLGLSQVWRIYEEMLGHAEKDEDNGAGNVSLTLPNLMGTGLNFNAAYRQEFASDMRQSWQVGAYRMFGPVNLGVYYQELSNDLTSTDRRLYASLSLPLGAGPLSQASARADHGQALADKKTEQVLADTNLIRRMSGLNPGDDRQKPNSKAAWLRNPVQGMGTPNLRVAQQVQRRVDQTRVDMDGMPDGSTVEGNILTLNGFPALEAKMEKGSTPSALDAFSIGGGGTSVKVEISKLPAPEKVWASFQQKDGNYAVVYLKTEKGSAVITLGDTAHTLPDWLWLPVWADESTSYGQEGKQAVLDAVKNQRPKVSLSGPSLVYVNDKNIYSIEVQYPQVLLDVYLLYLIHNNPVKRPWETVWIEPRATGDKAVASFFPAGQHFVRALVHFDPIYPSVDKSMDVYAREREKKDDDSGGGAAGSCNITGNWQFTEAGAMNYFVTFDGAGRVVSLGGPMPHPNPMGGGVTSNTTALAGNTVSGVIVSTNPGGDNFVHTLNLTCNGSTMSGTISIEVNGGPPTVYNVNGVKL